MINKIIKLMSGDKALHFLWSFLIVIIFTKLINIYLGVGLGILFGVFKELYDDKKYRKWDWKDLISDILGIILAILCIA